MNARQWRGAMIIIMRATLHDRATNTYYGPWLGKKARNTAQNNELMASAGFVTFNVPA